MTAASSRQETREMQIHIARNGQRMGPFSLEEINRQLAAGTLSLSDQAWYEGAGGWVPLSTGTRSEQQRAGRQPTTQSVPGRSNDPERAGGSGPDRGRSGDSRPGVISSDRAARCLVACPEPARGLRVLLHPGRHHGDRRSSLRTPCALQDQSNPGFARARSGRCGSDYRVLRHCWLAT